MKMLTIMLSWNRPHLIQKTIESYIRETTVPYDLIVVDNASNKETVKELEVLKDKHNFRLELLKENMGGLAFNYILDSINLNDYDYIHFSENDIEYLPNWAKTLIKKLETFPKVGQISPFSPFPQSNIGEFSWKKPATFVSSNNQSIYFAKNNVGTNCIVRTELIKQGLRWKNIETNQGFRFPNDLLFSIKVKKMGWNVAFNDQYVGINWGHNITELQKELDYYVKNHKSKSFQRFKKQLRNFNLEIYEDEDGSYKLRKINQST
ncbi:glycosyltransferase family 2 protein [Peribacillus asahii]|uniref:glycosyltransferase family 2 protein n=1 Tax=Peribacillus asahii TaxID=228899 RepID=UPI0038248911